MQCDACSTVGLNMQTGPWRSPAGLYSSTVVLKNQPRRPTSSHDLDLDSTRIQVDAQCTGPHFDAILSCHVFTVLNELNHRSHTQLEVSALFDKKAVLSQR